MRAVPKSRRGGCRWGQGERRAAVLRERKDEKEQNTNLVLGSRSTNPAGSTC